MKTTHSFSIDFLVRRCKEDRKSGFVYAWITMDGECAETVTAGSVKQAYLGVQKKAKRHKLVELLEFYSKAWSPKLSKGSFKNYKTTIDYMKRFLEQSFSGDIYLSQLSMEFVRLFETYAMPGSFFMTVPGKSKCIENTQGFHRLF